ncbi:MULTISPECIES: hypothetical protein [Sorangium]|uniref:hypothetical protein n=1 Tax=Sorangium TaxID=39643 RepID=UPI003D9C3895
MRQHPRSCEPTGGVVGHMYATDYFSKEGTDTRYCNHGYWITGITCSGDHCNDISLQCSRISNFSATSCHWTGWMSEEGGGSLSFGAGYSMVGAQCDGRCSAACPSSASGDPRLHPRRPRGPAQKL